MRVVILGSGRGSNAEAILLAQQAGRRITRKVIAELQRMKHLLSGNDSELSGWIGEG